MIIETVINATTATKLDPPYQETTDPPNSSDSDAENNSSHRETQANRAEASTNINTTIQEDVYLKLLKANTIAKSTINPDSNWETVKLTSRAGKLTGKYKNWWNTENTYTGDQNSRHTPCCFGNTPSPTQDKVQTHQNLITKSSGDTLHAKLRN